MFKQNEKISLETQKALATALDLVATSLDSVEKLTHLQLENSRQILAETSQVVKDLAGIRDPKEMLLRVNQVVTQAMERNIASARGVYAIVTGVQAKVSKVAEDSLQSAQQAALTSLEGLVKLNPNGVNLASESLKSWINSSNQAFNAMNKAAAQVSNFTTNGINAVTEATVSAAKKAAKQ